MRAYLGIRNVKEGFPIDSIVLENKKSGTELQLDFEEVDWRQKGYKLEIRLKEESNQSLVPSDLGELGNNDSTYNYLRDCKVLYINAGIEDESVSNCKLAYLRMEIGDRVIHYKCNNVQFY